MKKILIALIMMLLLKCLLLFEFKSSLWHGEISAESSDGVHTAFLSSVNGSNPFDAPFIFVIKDGNKVIDSFYFYDIYSEPQIIFNDNNIYVKYKNSKEEQSKYEFEI